MTQTAESTQRMPPLAVMGEFRPFAAFDESLDCIRVFTRDCSIKEIRIDKRLTLLEDNFPGGDFKYVGFTIKGAKHLCKECGFDLEMPIWITEILDVLVASSPDQTVRAIIEGIARPMLAKEQIATVVLKAAA